MVFWCDRCYEEHDQKGIVHLCFKFSDGFMLMTTVWQQLHINNTQFSLLEASEDFMSSALILLTGIFTDRLGGTGMF